MSLFISEFMAAGSGAQGGAIEPPCRERTYIEKLCICHGQTDCMQMNLPGNNPGGDDVCILRYLHFTKVHSFFPLNWVIISSFTLLQGPGPKTGVGVYPLPSVMKHPFPLVLVMPSSCSLSLSIQKFTLNDDEKLKDNRFWSLRGAIEVPELKI